MGWAGHRLKEGWSLFTRGGLRGVFISNNKEGKEKVEIKIPDELLQRLAADHIRTNKIGQLENMPDAELLGG